MKIYSPTNAKVKPIEVRLNKEETEQLVIALYRNVNKNTRLVKKGR